MNNKLMNVITMMVPLLLLSSGLVWAEAKADQTSDAEAPQAAADATAASVVDAAEGSTEDDEGASDRGVIMDGSSLEAFNQSLEEVRETAGEDAYQTMQAATAYLLLHDIGARGSKEKLAARLDGLTASEVLRRTTFRPE